MPNDPANAATKRRMVLKTLGGSALAGTLADRLPVTWQRPLVESAILPAHAQVSFESSLLFRIERNGEEQFPLVLPYVPRTSGDALFGITLYPSDDSSVPPAGVAGRFPFMAALFPSAHAQGADNRTFLRVLTRTGALIPASGNIIFIELGEVHSNGTVLDRCSYPIRVLPGPADEPPLIIGGGGDLGELDFEELRRLAAPDAGTAAPAETAAPGSPAPLAPLLVTDSLPRQGMRCGSLVIYPGQWADLGGFVNGFRLSSDGERREPLPPEFTAPAPQESTYTWTWTPTSGGMQYSVTGSFKTSVSGILGPDNVTEHVYTVSGPSGELFTVDLSNNMLTLAGGEAQERAFNHQFRFNTATGIRFDAVNSDSPAHPVNFLSLQAPLYGLQYSAAFGNWALHNADNTGLLTGITGIDAGPSFRPTDPAATTPAGPAGAMTTAGPGTVAEPTTTTTPTAAPTAPIPTTAPPTAAPTTTAAPAATTTPAPTTTRDPNATTPTPVERTFSYTWSVGTGADQHFVEGSFVVPATHTSNTIRHNNVSSHTLKAYMGADASGTLLYTIDFVAGTLDGNNVISNEQEFEFNAITKTFNTAPTMGTTVGRTVELVVNNQAGLYYNSFLAVTPWQLNSITGNSLVRSATGPVFS